MRVSKINTSSFAVSQSAEREVRLMAESARRDRAVTVSLEGRYAPLAKFKVVRRERVVTGSLNFLAMKKTFYRENVNYMYVNLNNARLVYAAGKGRYGIELSEIDFFERIMDVPSNILSSFGYLIENGSTKKEEFEPDTLKELIARGLAEEYVYERNIFLSYFLREVGDFVGSIPEGRRELVRPAYIIPRFDSPLYNLGKFLEADDTIDASYLKDSVKYAEEQVRGVLNTIFAAKTELVEICYLPYIQYRTVGRGSSERHNYIVACLKGGLKAVYQHPFKLKPISLYSMEVGSKIVAIEGDNVTFDDVGNLKAAKEEIMRLIRPLKSAAKIGDVVYQMGGGILFYGPPGCGKTYLAKATVGEIGISFISGNIEDIMGEGLDMAAKKLHDIFDYARSAQPCVLFFDEIDAIASRRNIYGPNTLVNQLLTEMDGIVGTDGDVLIIGATNMPWSLDPALLRGGRFTQQVYIKPPDIEGRAEMFSIYLKKYAGLLTGVNVRELASLTEYYSAADIKTVVDRAGIYALEYAEKSRGRKQRLQQWHLIQAIKERKSSLIPWFRFAEKQMDIEGAKESYPQLWEDIKKFNSAMRQNHESSESAEFVDMMEKFRDDVGLRK
jgi:AAA+ superfamily predicted ATPase